MKYLYALIAITFTSFSNAAESLDINEIKAGLESKDAKYYSYLLWKDWNKFQLFLEKVESGDPQWLKVGKLLEQYTDAGVSTALSLTFARAIQNNPKEVLQIMSEYDVKWSCSVPLLEPKKSDYDAFVKKTTIAVQSLNVLELTEKKIVCLENLEKARDFSENHWPDYL